MSSGRSLLSTTRAANVALRAARVTESTLLGVTAFASILACAVRSSGEPPHLQELVLSLVCGLLAAAAWWWPHRLAEHAVAARLDSRLKFEGAYLTAWEVESGQLRSTPLARLLGARVLARVRPSHAVGAVLPHSAPWIAAPFVGAALLALALAEVRTSNLNSNTVVTTRSLAGGLADLRSEAAREGELDVDELARLDELVREARELAQEAASPETGDSAEIRRRMEDLARELEHLASESPADSGLRQELEENQVRADQALMTLSELGGEPDGGSALDKPGATDGTEVASGTEPGTMSGSPGGDPSSISESPDLTMRTASDDAPNSAGVFSRGRWWPVRHDKLVSSWVEARRDHD